MISPLIILAPTFLWMLGGKQYIQFLRQKSYGQFIREEGPESHQKKAGTPTMGGFYLLFVTFLSMLFLTRFDIQHWSVSVGLVWLTIVVLGGLGMSDDLLKILKKHNKGVHGYTKLAIQALLGLIIGLYVLLVLKRDAIGIPGLFTLHLGLFYPVFAALIMTTASNSYNLTDGLDGLAATTGFLTLMGLGFILSAHHADPSLLTLTLLLAGSCLGFFIYNRYPAQIFMGDTGSLSLGGAMATIAILSGCELALLLLGFVFMLESLSVVIQVISFKTTGKRVFKMSPLHHHFELCGWKETQIVFAAFFVQAITATLAIFIYN